MTRPRLAVLAEGRDNNLNLIRMLAASAVLLSHSYVVSSGDPQAEPWVATLNMTPGGVAVDAFFALSGFLVSGSLERGSSLGDFVKARALRIYPGLWMALMLTVLTVGIGFSSLSPAAFFQDAQTWRYLLKNAVMIAGAEAVLPGAFDALPFAHQVNGSLWTLRWELRLYLVLVLGWWILQRAVPARHRLAAMQGLALASTGILLVAAQTLPHSLGSWTEALRLGAMFFAGVACWHLRQRLVLDARVAWLALAAMAMGAMVGPKAFEWVYRLCFPYVLMVLAFVPGGGMRRYTQVGDYSYGIYVYAFPVQQMVVTLLPGLSTWALSGIAWPVSLLIAVLSWHTLEQPALRWKHRRLDPTLGSVASRPS